MKGLPFKVAALLIAALFIALSASAQQPTGEPVEEPGEPPVEQPLETEAPPAPVEPTGAEERQTELFESYERLARVMDIVQSRYVQPVDSKTLFEGALKGIMDSLDPYSSYIPPESYDAFMEETEQHFSGIGVTIGVEENAIKVIATLEDMPAFRAGVQPGDLIVKIEGTAVRDIGGVVDAARRLRGERGTSVEITLYRPSTDKEFTVTLVREDIPVASLRGYRTDVNTGKWDFMLNKNLKIGYIRITKFVQNTPEELSEAYEGLVRQGMKGLIIDLRYNPGGLMDSTVAIVDRFIDQGVIVRTQGRGGIHSESYARPYDSFDPPLPVVILVNEYSASASEIMGAALQDYGRAVLVGTRTFGKASVQSVIPLDGRGAIRITVAHYYTPAGRLVHRVSDAEVWGLDPDVVEEMSAEEQIKLREEWASVAGGNDPKSLGEGDEPVIDTQLARAVDILHGGLLMRREKVLSGEN
ncbi:MAG: S41 family peptidase [Planctomycetota bacterium]|jgi:carboxyl-terminal processing protease